MSRRPAPALSSLAVLFLSAASSADGAAGAADAKAKAQQILEATEVKGGLIVHVGCSDGRLTAALRAGGSYLVHGLDADPAHVTKAREHIRSLGAYGPVSVAAFDGMRMPYIDNLVNLVVADGLGQVPTAEVLRVLRPGGVAYVRSGGKWARTVKPWPRGIDEWTHYLHDASNNAAAHDTVVGPPRRYQWVGAPRWARHHDHMASMSALVSAKGRLFYIFDEGSTASILLPSKWFLAARDAFNGTMLWKRPIAQWHTQLWPLKSGPATLPRRLVAIGDRVFVTLGIDAPVSALDAATGETIRTYKKTEGTEEILASEGVLLLVGRAAGPDAGERQPPASVAAVRARQRTLNCDGANRAILAVDAESGNLLWRHASQVVPLTLAADGQRVFFYDGDKAVCLDRKTGKQQWVSQSLPRSARFPSGYAPTLVVYGDVVLFAGGENMLPHHGAQDFMQALSAATGKLLWTAEHPPSGYQSPEDILVASGLVWTGATTQGEDSGEFTGRDPLTGEVKLRYVPKVRVGYGHHRCYRAKATDRYILTSRSGIEFLDVRSTEWEQYRWIRGACLYGILACNGLIYSPPHDCACLIEGKVSSFTAVAPAKEGRGTRDEGRGEKAARLEKGPAFGQIGNRQSAVGNRDDWPMYRHDGTRSGRTKAEVPTTLRQAWETGLGGRLSSPVVADGKLLVAAVDAHTVHALDAGSGKRAWSYTAGGRVDSPPTLWQGRVLFGCADGWVYCLRAQDGALAWRFRAAPEDRRMMAFNQVESLWPVSGSVLVLGDVVYCVAGRSAYLDGGMRLLRLDAGSGRKLSETVLDGPTLAAKRVQVAQPDILSSDGRRVYMKSLCFSLDGACEGVPTRNVREQFGDETHLFSPTSFLDDAWWHRSYWVYGRAYAPGATGYYLAGLMAPSGRILAFDDSAVYGFGRKAKYYRWTTPLEHVLFAADKERGDFELPRRRLRTSSIQVTPSPSLDPGAKPTTIEVWAKPLTGNGVIVARGGPKGGIALLCHGGKPQLIVRARKQLAVAEADASVVNQWAHLAGVASADGKVELYVDGRLAASAKAPGLPALGAKATIDIGLDTGGAVGDYRAPYGFVGLLDEVRIYARALPAAELQQHAADPRQVPAGGAAPVLRYSFDKGKPSPQGEGKATDESGNANDGTTMGLRFAEGRIGRAGRFIGARRSIMRLPFAVRHHWAQDIPILVRAMLLADKTLFVAGPPDLVDEEEAARNTGTPRIQAALADQAAALDGRKGALLWAVSAADGKKLAEHKLSSMPTFDGMIAAHGRLYLTTTDGKVLCMMGSRP